MTNHDTALVCETCGRTSTANFAHSLAHGWEKCCNATMSIDALDDPITIIQDAVDDVVGSPLAAFRRSATRNLGGSTLIATALIAATAATAAAQPVPTILPRHAERAEHAWPHQANRAEMLEATRAVHRYTRTLLPRKRRAIRTECRTGRTGMAGRYACRIRNQKGGTRGVPRILRAAVLRVWEDGSWELTYRGRVQGGRARVTYTQAKNGRASSARYTPVQCCTVDRTR